MRVIFHGYRDWALKILENLLKEKREWKIVNKDKDAVHLYYGWSWMLPKEVYEKNLCLILHLSDLPKFRGGSPLQHQILAGLTRGAFSICRVESEVDSGDIYAKRRFSLEGSLDEIFERIVKKGTEATIKMLDDLARGETKPKPQNEKKATYFKRRKPEESELKLKDFRNKSAEELYNIIRCLADPYPNAFIVCKDGKK